MFFIGVDINIIDPREPLYEYLLGTIPEEDKIKIEKRLTRSERFRVELARAEDTLIVAYINNGISKSNKRLFENFFLSTEGRRQKLKLVQDCQEKLQQEWINIKYSTK